MCKIKGTRKLGKQEERGVDKMRMKNKKSKIPSVLC